MLVAFCIVMGLSATYAQDQEKATGLAVIPFLFLYFGFYVIAWTPLSNMYSVEILPFHLRAKGQAIYNTVQATANGVNQWVNPIILGAIHWKYYGVYIGILSFYIVLIYFKFPETKNLTMEQIAVVFEPERAMDIEVAKTAKDMGKGANDVASVRIEHVETPSSS
jgi:MFS family permease